MNKRSSVSKATKATKAIKEYLTFVSYTQTMRKLDAPLEVYWNVVKCRELAFWAIPKELRSKFNASRLYETILEDAWASKKLQQ